jgi:hypothetical protein
MLRELRLLVPNLSSLAFFIGADGRLTGGYADNPEAPALAGLYFSEFHGRRGRELGGVYPDNIKVQFGVQDHADALGAINVEMNALSEAISITSSTGRSACIGSCAS